MDQLIFTDGSNGKSTMNGDVMDPLHQDMRSPQSIYRYMCHGQNMVAAPQAVHWTDFYGADRPGLMVGCRWVLVIPASFQISYNGYVNTSGLRNIPSIDVFLWLVIGDGYCLLYHSWKCAKTFAKPRKSIVNEEMVLAKPSAVCWLMCLLMTSPTWNTCMFSLCLLVELQHKLTKQIHTGTLFSNGPQPSEAWVTKHFNDVAMGRNGQVTKCMNINIYIYT